MSNRLPAGLDRGSIAILRAVIAAIRPRGSGFDQPIDDEVLHAVDGFLRRVPAPLRLGLPFGLRLLEWGPIVFSRPRRAARLSRLPREEGERYLEGWLEAGGLRGTLVLGLRTLVFMAFYQNPTVLESLGVDWQGRARERIARRTELLREGA